MLTDVFVPSVDVAAAYSGPYRQNAQFSWATNLEGVTDYEVWWGNTAEFVPGENCGGASNCASNGTSTNFSPPVPAVDSIVFYKIVAVNPDGRTVSNTVFAAYFTNLNFLSAAME